MTIMMDKSNQIIAAGAATVGAFGLGTVLAWTSPALQKMTETTDTFISDEDESWIGAMLPLAAFVSVPVCGILMDQVGRKNTMLILSVPFVLGWILIGYSKNLAMMFAGRFISGFCGGGFSLVAPIFIGEIAELDIRGALGTGFQLMIVLGILFVNVVGKFADWKWLSLICGFVPLIFLAALIFVQDSPIYLLLKGERTGANQALHWFRKNTPSDQIEEEFKVIEASVMEATAEKLRLGDLKLSYNLRPSIIMFCLMFFQQMSGINAVIFYTKDIFEAAGSNLDPMDSSIIVTAVQVIATLVPLFIVDKVGRKVLLITSEAIMCGSLIALGYYFKLQETGNEVVDGLGWLPLVSLMIFISAYSIGLGPLPWVMSGELLPLKTKVLVACLSTMFNWFLAFLVTKFYQNLLYALNASWCYWGFATVCAVGTIFIVLVVPETKGRSIQEVQKYFGNPNPAGSG